MSEIVIPAAALEAGARAITMALILAVEEDCRALALTDDERMELSRAAFLAMIKAWPNRVTVKDDGRRQTYIIPAIILPLTKKRGSASPGLQAGDSEHWS